MLKYLKAAFKNRWNLLALMAGTGVAIIGGRPDVVLPLVLAAEAAYLAIVGGNSKFQTYVDTQRASGKTCHPLAKEPAALATHDAIAPARSARPVPPSAGTLPELQSIAADLKQHGDDDVDHSLESFQAQSLDRLLWIYLRLLFTYHSLQKFLEQDVHPTHQQRYPADRKPAGDARSE